MYSVREESGGRRREPGRGLSEWHSLSDTTYRDTSPASSVTIGMMEIKMISRIVSGENKFQTTGDKTCKVL